ncbi:integrase [Orientia tsutsugamushi str. Gilliam]|uniref:Integrase n=1 Tax=Orientia tsutsugamushi str. Gilliam TaxID=1359184 RepID=A0A2U3QY35_ORITS|nr:integrase [Orientia tsutsugamushi str. Gilliam]
MKDVYYRSANNFLKLLSPIFNKFIKWGLIDKNPVIGIERHKVQLRDKYNQARNGEIYSSTSRGKNKLIRDFILITLLTAIRKNNVFKMRWKDIRFIEQIWYISDTKNRKP